MVKIGQKLKRQRWFCVSMLCTEICALKTSLSLYFLTDFNNSHTILTRIASQFRFSIQSRNLKSADRLASFSKHVFKLWLLFGQFFWEFNDSHVILTRLVSQIRTSFWNQNRTIVARSATILVCAVGFPRQNWAGWMIHRVSFWGGPHSNCLLYDGTSKSTLKAAMSYMTYTRWKAWEKSKMQ
jgi:hypothetical protein